MPQFLVEDVIAETCDETAIMGEWETFIIFLIHCEVNVPIWTGDKLVSLENKIKMSHSREYF